MSSSSDATTIESTDSIASRMNRSAESAADGNRSDSQLVEFLDGSRFWVQRVLLPFIVTVGVFGNAVTIVVLTRRGMRSSTNTYLTALAVADIVYLSCILWLSLMHYPLIQEDRFTFYWYTWPYTVWLTDASTNTSVWLTVSFTVERYIAVCHPMRGKVLCTESRARRVICGVFVFCFATTLTTPFEWTVDEATNSTRPVLGQSWLGMNETYRVIYYWFTCMTFVFLPLSLLIVFNTFLIRSVRQSKYLRRVMTCDDRAARSEIRITVTLIAVVALFLICQLPTAATLIYTSLYEPSHKSNEEILLRGLGNIFNLLVSVNAASNFILYCALSDKYLRVFVRTFCRCVCQAHSPSHTASLHNEYSPSRRATMRFNSKRSSTQPHASKRYLGLPVGCRNNERSYHSRGASRSLRLLPNLADKEPQQRFASVRSSCGRCLPNSSNNAASLHRTETHPTRRDQQTTPNERESRFSVQILEENKQSPDLTTDNQTSVL